MYDCIIIGAGSGGLNIASFLNSIGLKILLIDKSDEHIGGDCLNTGCVPSKALIHVARMRTSALEAAAFGLRVEGTMDLQKVLAHVRGAQDVIREHENAEWFRSKGMDVVFGAAAFAGHDAVEVAGKQYRGKKIIIATGSQPRMLTIPGVDEVQKAGRMYTNENIFSMAKLPEKLLVIGAGPIGIELGQAFRHLGSDVTVVTKDKAILPREDAKIASVLQTRLEKDGVKFVFGADTVRFEGGNALVAKDTTGKETSLSFDAVLVSIGRTLELSSLALEKAGIEVTKKGTIQADEYLRTTNPCVYVCGDIAGQHQFTHAAELHAGLIIRNFLTPIFKRKLSTDALSWVTYTSPEIATYGLSEATLKERNVPYTVLESSFEEDDRAITDDARDGYTKMFIHAKSKKILGGTVVAPNAGELIQELILATANGLSIGSIFKKIYPYPTAARINKRLVANHERTRLTPFTRRILRALFSIS